MKPRAKRPSGGLKPPIGQSTPVAVVFAGPLSHTISGFPLKIIHMSQPRLSSREITAAPHVLGSDAPPEARSSPSLLSLCSMNLLFIYILLLDLYGTIFALPSEAKRVHVNHEPMGGRERHGRPRPPLRAGDGLRVPDALPLPASGHARVEADDPTGSRASGAGLPVLRPTMERPLGRMRPVPGIQPARPWMSRRDRCPISIGWCAV